MTAPPLTPLQQVTLRAKLSHGFSPSAPINQFELFAGRLGQVKAIFQAIGSRGRHAILYGERGVGKTSLATVLKEIYSTGSGIGGVRIAKINCDAADTFYNVWKKMLAKIGHLVEGHSGAPQEVQLADLMPQDHFGPGEACTLCNEASEGGKGLVLIFDEFDCLNPEHRAMFAPTMKELSDNSVETTLVLVGVSRDVKDLIAEHASVDRCMVQIPMPTMSHDEIREVINKVLAQIGMTIDEAALDKIVLLSQGFPHYAHLLGQESGFVAVDGRRTNITIEDVNSGIAIAIQNTRQTTRSDYQKASEGQRKGTLFPQVLLACAVANVDDLGYFSSADIREPLRQLTGKQYDIPNYAQHLDKLSKDAARGPVLEKLDLGYRLRFRFRNPMLRPFIVMKGLADGELTGNLIGLINQAQYPSQDTSKIPSKRPASQDAGLFNRTTEPS
jgi:Cdc6-like AAA superfamily ATPase